MNQPLLFLFVCVWTDCTHPYTVGCECMVINIPDVTLHGALIVGRQALAFDS